MRTVIEANSVNKINFRELYRYRDLFYTLALRDYRVRYAQTFLGFSWAIIQPLFTLLIFIVVFEKAAKVNTGGIPYPLFAICGQSAWVYFSYVVSQSGSSIIGAQEMVKKIYFPRIIIPVSKSLVGIIDLSITLILIAALMLYYGVYPTTNILIFPLFLLLCMISSLSLGIWLSALTVRFRDMQHVVPFIIQFGLYATPVAYPSHLVLDNIPNWAGVLYFLNPMAGIVEGFRWSIIGGQPLMTESYISFTIGIILLITGLIYFNKVERIMADIV